MNRYLPPIGLRIVKSAVAIALCYVVSFLRGNGGIVFYSHLAALWCIQMYTANSKKNAVQRIEGTLVGSVYGLIFLLVKSKCIFLTKYSDVFDAFAISGMIIIVLYTTVLLKKKQASYFSCVVFLSIAVNHLTDENPYLFVWNRFLDTMIGIVIGIGVDVFSLPKERRRDILFISGVDDTLLNAKGSLSDYSRVELNRILDNGANFTLSTGRTPASIMEAMGEVRLRLPVIAMEGAVLYDIGEKRYLKKEVISEQLAERVLNVIKVQGLKCFSNVIVEDLLMIYYDAPEDEVQKTLVAKMRKSPYRNYICQPLKDRNHIVYFMLLYPNQVIEQLYAVLEAEGLTDELKVLKYHSLDDEGYTYMKIYSKEASKEKMTEYLKQMLNIQETVTFGSIEGRYDVVVGPGDMNRVVHILKKRYEPVRFPGFLKS